MKLSASPLSSQQAWEARALFSFLILLIPPSSIYSLDGGHLERDRSWLCCFTCVCACSSTLIYPNTKPCEGIHYYVGALRSQACCGLSDSCRRLSSVSPKQAFCGRGLRNKAMPPKPALTNAFLVSPDAENEVVCPLINQDGSQCRKRCIGVRFAQSIPTRYSDADLNPTGKTIQVNARTHPTRTSRQLYSQTTCNGGEFPVDDQYSPFKTTPNTAWCARCCSQRRLYVTRKTQVPPSY